MNYRYRVKGRTEKAFILRGMYFRIGAEFNNQITESELPFVQSHCSVTEIVDLKAKTIASQPIPTNSKTIDKGVQNELLTKPTSRGTKGKTVAKV